MKLKLIGTKPEAGNVKSFIWQPEQPVEWIAGQFMHYSLKMPDGSINKHYFTVSSPPHTGTPQISTRISESDFKQTLNSLKIGDFIEATPPDGDFVWEDSDKPILFIAGGIGVTPFHSILLDRDHNNLPLNLTLVYASRDDKIVFKEEFDALAKKHSELTIKYIVGH
jgi:ferredoxin-NADP reductase